MNFKILIVGKEAVGKCSLIQMYQTQKFINVGPLNAILKYSTNYGVVHLYLTQSRTYENDHDANIIMFDLSRPSTMKILDSIPANKKPQIVVGNKFDIADIGGITKKFKQRQIIYKGYTYSDISVKYCIGLEVILLFLLKNLVAKDIKFI